MQCWYMCAAATMQQDRVLQGAGVSCSCLITQPSVHTRLHATYVCIQKLVHACDNLSCWLQVGVNLVLLGSSMVLPLPANTMLHRNPLTTHTEPHRVRFAFVQTHFPA
jgi:hypothetical protein